MFGTLLPYMSLLCYANFDPLNILSSVYSQVDGVSWANVGQVLGSLSIYNATTGQTGTMSA